MIQGLEHHEQRLRGSGVVQPGEEQAAERSSGSLSVPEGGLWERQVKSF